MNDDTLQDYFDRATKRGVIDFDLRLVRSPEGLLDFYIHPHDKNGETGDFHVSGGFVTRVPGRMCAGSSRPTAAPLVGTRDD